MEGRKQKFQTAGKGEGTRRKAKKRAQQLSEMEKVAESPEDRFLQIYIIPVREPQIPSPRMMPKPSRSGAAVKPMIGCGAPYIAVRMRMASPTSQMTPSR
jgi:hypothetical protein